MQKRAIIFTAVLAAAVLFVGFSINAQTTQEQVDTLMKQISELNAIKETLQAQQQASQALPSVTVTFPNGGENLQIGTKQTIRWTSTGFSPKVNMQIILQNIGARYTQIVAIIAPNTGTFAWNLPKNYKPGQYKISVRGTEYVDGKTITASDASDQTFNIVSSAAGGSLAISKDTASPVSDIVIAGQIPTLALFRMTASSVESLDVDQMKFNITGGNYVDTLYFYKGATLLGTLPGSTSATLTLADGQLIIPQNNYSLITVKAKLLQNAPNGTELSVNLADADAVRTTGLASRLSIKSGTQTAIGNPMIIYKSRPFFSKDTYSPSGALVAGTNTLLAIFDVRADAGGDIVFDDSSKNALSINLTKIQKDADGAAQKFTLRDEGGSILDYVTVSDSATSFVFDFSDFPLTVPAGATRKLYVYANTTDFEDGNDTIQLWLDDNNVNNISWGIDEMGSFNEADKIFRGDIYAGVLSQPANFAFSKKIKEGIASLFSPIMRLFGGN